MLQVMDMVANCSCDTVGGYFLATQVLIVAGRTTGGTGCLKMIGEKGRKLTKMIEDFDCTDNAELSGLPSGVVSIYYLNLAMVHPH